MAGLLTDAELVVRLAQARSDYQGHWQAVDQELYALCQRRPGHRAFGDVYAKIVVIGRVYAAGVLRSSRAVIDREAEAARGIMQQAAGIDTALKSLAGASFNRTVAARVIELHGHVTSGLLPYTGGRRLESFVSKYLHFHCPLVPIFDSRAETSIGRFVDWALVSQTRAAISRPAESPVRYYNFATAFTTLAERLAGIPGTVPSVKDIDHMLWRAA